MERLRRRFASEPVVWAICGLLARLWAEMRHRALARALSAPGLRVGAGSTLVGMRHVRFGRSFQAHGKVWIEAVSHYGGYHYSPAIAIGDDVSASDDLHISCIERVEVGNRVLFGSRVYVSDHNHGIYRGEKNPSRPDQPPAERALGGGGPVVICDDVWVGHNVVIVGPVTIGNGAIVGANSVVRHDVPAHTIVAGIPARALKTFEPELGQWTQCR